VLPDLKPRLGEFPLYAVATIRDDRVSYDVKDGNVNLSNLIVSLTSSPKVDRLGLFTLDHQVVLR
jgi:hypothetical protein